MKTRRRMKTHLSCRKRKGTKWKMTKVTDMEGMFQGAILFDQDIKTWDTKAVTNMKNMFNGAAAFNKELLPATNKWDTSAVTSMEGMFEGAAKFNNADQDTIKNR